MAKIHAGDIEIAIARYYNYRQKMIVPNVHWGLWFNHEIDLLVVSKARYATEIEIKVTLSDLKADKKKRHNHYSDKIKQLYFAVPEYLQEQAIKHIPERAGLFIVRQTKFGKEAKIVKTAKTNNARKLTDSEYLKLGHLAAMRIWSLKKHNYRLQRENKEVKDGG